MDHDEQLEALKVAVGEFIKALAYRTLELLEWVAERHWDLLEPLVELGTRKLVERGLL